MRDREELAAGGLLPFGHPLIEVFGVLALEGGVRQHAVGLVLVVAVDDVPVQVVATAGVRRPLVADERREAPRLVVLLGNRGVLRPDALGKPRIRRDRRQLLVRLRGDQFHHGLLGLHWTAVEHVAPPLERRVGHHLGIAALDLGDHAHHVGVIRDGDPVERLSELHRLAAGRHQFLAARKPRRLFGTERRAAAAGIHRPRRVDVFVTEVRALGIAPACVRRIARLLVELGRIGRLDLARVGGHRAGAGWLTAKLHGLRRFRGWRAGGRRTRGRL